MDAELHNVDHLSFNDGDIVLVDDISDVPQAEVAQVDFVMMIVCIEGRIQFLDEPSGKAERMQEGRQVTISAHQLYVCQPGTVLSDFMISPGMKCKVLSFRQKQFAKMMFVDKQLWSDIRHVRRHPALTLTEAEMETMLHYFSLLRQKLSETEESRYRREIMHGLITGLSFQLFSKVEQTLDRPAEPQPSGRIMQGDLLVRRFVEMVSESGGRIRSVTEFANRLNVSPKHLSSVVTKQTGRHVYDYIREATVSAIEQRLRHSDLSAKEIANEFDFPNLSFFGRFVKENLGASPTEYRRNLAV